MRHTHDAYKIELFARTGANVKARRLAAGLSCHQMADKLKININTYRSLEEGLGIPFATLAKVADIFDCTLDDLAPVSTRVTA